MTRRDGRRGSELLLVAGVAVCALLLASAQLSLPGALAQEEGGWSAPTLLSTTTIKSWFPDVAVDSWGRAYFVWHSERRENDDLLDLLMFTSWTGETYLEPNDVIFPGIGGFTVRPVIAADDQGQLHIVYRDGTNLYYTQARADSARSALSWRSSKLVSNLRSAYYSDIAVDRDGVLHVVWNEQPPQVPARPAVWVGTGTGVFRLDGDLSPTMGSPPEMEGVVVHAVLEDSRGGDWFGTSVGLAHYDGVTWEMVSLDDEPADVPILAIAQDIDETLWFCAEGRIFHYERVEDGDIRWTEVPFPPELAEATPRALAVDAIGQVWVGTTAGLGQYDGQGWRVYGAADGSLPGAVTALAGDYAGKLWVGTTQGVFERVNGQWDPVGGSDGFPVTALTWDPEADILWVGTPSGLLRYDGRGWQEGAGADGWPDGAIVDLVFGGEQGLWAATPDEISQLVSDAWMHYPVTSATVTALSVDGTPNAMCPLCMDIYYRHSEDGGTSWSAPVNLSRSFAGSVKPQVIPDDAGNVHVVWEEGEDWYLSEGYPVAAAYRRSPDGGATWDPAVAFSHPDGAPQQVTLSPGRDGELVAVWRLPLRLPDRSPVYYQLSDDRGATWSDPQPIPGLIAKDWLPMSLDASHSAGDSAGNVHLLVLGYLDPLEEELSLLHIVWDGEQWSEPVRLFTSNNPPEWPRLAVGMGNRLHATWFTRDEAHIWDSERGRYQVWAAYLETDAPSLSPEVPRPSQVVTPEETVLPVTPSPSAAPLSPLEESMPPQGLYTDSDDTARILVALSPVVLLLLGLLVARGLRRPR